MTTEPSKLEQRVLEVGDHLRDGTIVLSVDPRNNKALFLPANIFAGNSTFDKQDRIVSSANKAFLHGHNDWRRITDAEGFEISNVWDGYLLKAWQKVGKDFFSSQFENHTWQDDKDRPWFWRGSSLDNASFICFTSRGKVAGQRRFGRITPDCHNGFTAPTPTFVPVVREGSAWMAPEELVPA